MKCPLSEHKSVLPFTPHEREYNDCLQEECAWWLSQGDVCAIASLAVDMERICSFLFDTQAGMRKGG